MVGKSHSITVLPPPVSASLRVGRCSLVVCSQRDCNARPAHRTAAYSRCSPTRVAPRYIAPRGEQARDTRVAEANRAAPGAARRVVVARRVARSGTPIAGASREGVRQLCGDAIRSRSRFVRAILRPRTTSTTKPTRTCHRGSPCHGVASSLVACETCHATRRPSRVGAGARGVWWDRHCQSACVHLALSRGTSAPTSRSGALSRSRAGATA